MAVVSTSGSPETTPSPFPYTKYEIKFGVFPTRVFHVTPTAVVPFIPTKRQELPEHITMPTSWVTLLHIYIAR